MSTTSIGSKTEVEILAKAIDTDGRAERGDASLGRFLVSSDGFLDPATYGAGHTYPSDSILLVAKAGVTTETMLSTASFTLVSGSALVYEAALSCLNGGTR